MPDNIAISVKNVSKTFRLPHEKSDSIKSVFVNPFRKGTERGYEIQRALSDISFEIKKGEFFGIVGRNGSGKSTLLKIIAGIYQPNSGEIKLNGRLVPFIELGVGFNPELSGRDNVFLNGALMGFSMTEVEAKYHDIVEFAEIERFMDQKLKNYSSGMQVRLAFAVATVLAESDILLIDEVLAVGDAEFQRKCFDYFRTLKKNNKTVIFVSHDMSAIREYCDRAVLIEKSKVIASGTSEEIAKEYTRLFLPELYKQHQHDEEKRQNKGKWGAGGVSITMPTFDKKRYLHTDKVVKVSVEMRATKDLPKGLLLGIGVKNQQGQVICGTNNKILKKFDMKHTVKSGTVLAMTWELPNIFGDGTYTIEPTAMSYDGTEIYEWWDDATSFIVMNEENTPYVVSPQIDINVQQK